MSKAHDGLRQRWIALAGPGPLLALALIAVAGRATALTGGEPSRAWYLLMPAVVREDAQVLDRWFLAQAPVTWVHILSGSLVLVLATLQFVPGLRRQCPQLHRWSGRVILLAGVAAASSGILLLILLSDRRPLALAGEAFWLGVGVLAIAGELWVRFTRAPDSAGAT